MIDHTHISGYSGEASWCTISERAWNTWLQVASYIWPTLLGLGISSNNESVSCEVLTQQECCASKHVQPWRIVSIWSLAMTWSEKVVWIVGLLKVSKQSSVQQVFSWKVWVAVRGHTGPNPHPIPKSQNIPIHFLWCFKRHMEYQGHVDISSLNFGNDVYWV